MRDDISINLSIDHSNMGWASMHPSHERGDMRDEIEDDISMNVIDWRWRQHQCNRWEMTSASIYPSIIRIWDEHPCIHPMRDETWEDERWEMRDEIEDDISINVIDWRWRQYQCNRWEMTSASIYQSIIRIWDEHPYIHHMGDERWERREERWEMRDERWHQHQCNRLEMTSRSM